MAVNTTQYFRNPAKVLPVYHAVTASESDVFSADATYLRDVTTLVCINENASTRDLSIYVHDGTNDKLLTVITVAGSAGQAVGIPPVRLISDPSNQIPGVRLDAFGSYFFRIPPGSKIRAKASAASSLFLIGQIEGYEA